MALLVRIYFNAVFGALGGLLGWMLFGVFGDKQPTRTSAWLSSQTRSSAAPSSAALIGYFVVSVEAIRDRSLVRFARLAVLRRRPRRRRRRRRHVRRRPGQLRPGRRLGGIGGAALGLLVTDARPRPGLELPRRRHRHQRRHRRPLAGQVQLRHARRRPRRLRRRRAVRPVLPLRHAELAGDDVDFCGAPRPGHPRRLHRLAVGPGAGVFQPASVKVLRGWQEGREYPLDKPANLLGRDEHADIALFRDMKVEKTARLHPAAGRALYPGQ